MDLETAFKRPVFARARRLCLALPETTESLSWSHPNFRAGKKTFCTFEMINARPSIAFRLPAPDVDRALERDGFFATPYGHGLWVSTWIDDAVNWKVIAELVEASYRSVALNRMLAALGAEARPA